MVHRYSRYGEHRRWQEMDGRWSYYEYDGDTVLYAHDGHGQASTHRDDTLTNGRFLTNSRS